MDNYENQRCGMKSACQKRQRQMTNAVELLEFAKEVVSASYDEAISKRQFEASRELSILLTDIDEFLKEQI